MSRRALILLATCALASPSAQADVPQECLQAPERQTYCPHTLYRVARVAVPSLAINQGGMVCLCLSDLTDLPVSRQQAAFTSIAQEYGLPPLALYRLLEIPAPDWAKANKR